MCESPLLCLLPQGKGFHCLHSQQGAEASEGARPGCSQWFQASSWGPTPGPSVCCVRQRPGWWQVGPRLALSRSRDSSCTCLLGDPRPTSARWNLCFLICSLHGALCYLAASHLARRTLGVRLRSAGKGSEAPRQPPPGRAASDSLWRWVCLRSPTPPTSQPPDPVLAWAPPEPTPGKASWVR